MIKTDFLVIGSGIAGLSFGLKVARFGRVTIVTKGKIEDSNTKMAQGGLAAVISKEDNFDFHIRDTLRAGDGLCNRDAVEILVKNAPKEIEWLSHIGVQFDKEDEKLALSKEAVHSKSRIVHSGDMTGKKIESVLAKKALENKNIKVYEKHIAFELIIDQGICIGARVLDIKKNKVIDFFSGATILTTGGVGWLYQRTTNPDTATGDGISLAFLAGADIWDMEFVQFHPTMLYNSNPSFLISETLRGEGGLLKNKSGKTYMEKYHRDGGLAPRDVVSKFSIEEMKATNSKCVYLDVRHLGVDYLKKRFPTIYKECKKYKIDISIQMIPVVPAAHYLCGGIKVDLNWKTSLDGLYAIGETSCSGLHGADRLASNSLTDGLVFSTKLIHYLKNKKTDLKEKKLEPIIIGGYNKKKIEQKLQKLMWEYVGITRSIQWLEYALTEICKMEHELDNTGICKDSIEIRNMLICGKLIATAATRRHESRGTHFLSDYPERDDKNWIKRIILNKNNV